MCHCFKDPTWLYYSDFLFQLWCINTESYKFFDKGCAIVSKILPGCKRWLKNDGVHNQRNKVSYNTVNILFVKLYQREQPKANGKRVILLHTFSTSVTEHYKNNVIDPSVYIYNVHLP